MKLHYLFLGITFFYSFFYVQNELFGLSIGGVTPSRQGYIVFPTGATDNSIVGYASLENGFRLADNATSCSFDGLLPISGLIDLNGGNLYLMESLMLSNTTKINTMGSIYGNGKTVKLSQNMIDLRSTATDLLLTTSAYTMGSTVNSVAFSQSFSYVLGAASVNALDPEIIVFYFDGAKLTATQSLNLATQGSICCRWQPGTTNFAFGRATGASPRELFSYRYNVSNGSLILVSQINLAGSRAVNSVAFNAGGNYLAAGQESAAGATELYLYSVTTGGALTAVANQSLPVSDHNVSTNAISWSPGGNYFAVGTAAIAGIAPDLLLYSWNGTTLTNTYSIKTGFTSNGVDWSPTGTFVAVAFSGSTTQNVLIYAHDISNGSFAPQVSAYINQTTDAISVAWTSDGNRLLVGSANAGGIGALRQYSFDKTATTLTLINTYSFNSSVNAVGTLLSNDQYLAGVETSIYLLSNQYADGFTLTFDNLNLQLTNNITLGAPLGIRGNCSIQGNRNSIDFDATGTIILLPNSRLYLKDLTLKNFGGTQLRCLDNTSTISLDNVTFNFNSPYYFNNGSFQIYNNFTLSGSTPLIYRSSVGSMIHKDSLFLCDYMSTFSYDPISNNRYGIQMIDRSSSLMLRNATLYSTATGLLLRSGNLLVDGVATIKNDGTSFAEAIQWGDGLTFTNDVRVTMMPGARCNVQSGYLVDRNLIL